MPLVLTVDQLQTGMVLAKSVLHNFQVLLPPGHAISENDIRYLKRTCAEQTFHIRPADGEDSVDVSDVASAPEPTAQASEQLRQKVESVAQKANEVLRNQVALQADQIAELESVIEQMLRHIRDNPLTLNILEQSVHWNEYLQRHGMQVFNFTLLLCYAIQDRLSQQAGADAGRLQQHFRSVTHLATAALFHDIGMTPIDYVYDKSESLSEEEKNAIRAHPRVGVELLPENINPRTRQAILQHHENFDGSGYIKGLQGEQIGIEARILRIVDSYTAAISRTEYRQAKPPIVALHEMVYGPYSPWYDPVLLHTFAATLQPLPIGAKIKMSSGDWAVVVRHHPEHPFCPQLIVAFDAQNRPLPRRLLSEPFYLGERRDIQVLSFGKTDLSFLNEARDSHYPAEFGSRLEAIGAALFEPEPACR
ncbi:MAG: HD domain-containing protein [Sedimentisphaerales bacterium]|nr:HD domain-containing protein [Sedimentisphaerales bacterium]